MFFRNLLLIITLLWSNLSFAQFSCPPNVDFEQGNTGYWKFYTGSCCPINTPSLTAALSNRHVLTSGAGLDPYGYFPVVAPGGGSYSLKLGNNSKGSQAERARYYVHVPTGVNNYSLIYRYAVVFENPNHAQADQPRFEVKAFDSATNAVIPCGQFTYISSSTLPGFTLSPNGYQVWYKSWSTASIDLSGQAGKTIAIDFASGDCALGAHFGYGYIDLTCGLFQIVSVNCNGAPTTTLTAPPGFQTYQWYNSGFSLVGTGQTVNIATPATTSQYHVVLTPYTGYGCPDTLTTTVSVSSLNVTASNDTFVCKGGSVPLNVNATGSSSVINYSWTPSTGLSCSNCANPIAAPVANTTYHVTVTDGNGCTKTDSIKVDAGPYITASSQSASCYNGNDGAATITAAQGLPPYSYSWNTAPVQNTTTVTNLTAGSYTAIVSDIHGCTDTANIAITQPAGVNVSLTHTDVNCFGDNNASTGANVTGGIPPYTYTWNTTPVQTTNNLSNLSAGIYTLTIADSNGCTDTASVTITQPDPLTVNVTNPSTVSCYGASDGSATVTATGGTAPYTYSWNTTPVQNTQTANNLAAGIYAVTVTDNNGCSATGTITITQPPLLSGNIISTSALCSGTASGTATTYVSGGTAPYSYLWNTIPTQNAATANNLLPGTYTVTITDNNGCTTNAVATITQPAPLSATINSTNVSCFNGSDGTAAAIVTGGTLPYTYVWNTIPSQSGNTINNLTTGNYIVTVTDSNGCMDTATTAITQPTPFTVTTFKTDISCVGYNNGTASAVATGGTAPYSYSWNTIPVQTSAIANNLTMGNYTVSITDNKGCIANAQVLINDAVPLVTSIESVSDINCFGDHTGSAAIAVSGGKTPYTYSWNTVPVQTKDTAINLGAGIYIVTITDSNGCTKTNNIQLTEPPQINTQMGTTSTCTGFSNGVAYATITGGVSPYNLLWNTMQTSDTLKNLPAGIYTLNVSDANNCTKTDTIVVTNYPALVIDAGDDQKLCAGASLQLMVTGAINYQWFPALALSCTTCYNPVTTANTDITYQVIGTDANHCSDTDDVHITIVNRIPVTVGTQQIICEGEEVSLYAAGGIGYNWSPASTLNNSNIANPIATPQATTQYQVIVTENECFSDTLMQEIIVYPLPSVDLGPDKNVTAGTTIEIPAITTHAENIIWSPATYLSCSDCMTPTARPEKNITYTVTVSNEIGCKAKDDITITVACEQAALFMPNTFTPNGDGINDTYFPSGKGISLIKRFTIYNRWGEKIYEAVNMLPNNATSGWDGTYKGEALRPDVFVYMVEALCFTDEPIVLKGDVSLIR